MAIVGLYRFRTLSGGLAAHITQSLEGRERLRAMGYNANCLQPVMGQDVGSIATVINFASVKDWAAAVTRINADAGWRTWYAQAAGSGAAEQSEAALLADVDPAFQPPAPNTIGAVSSTQWLPMPGKAAQLMAHIQSSLAHLTRLGGRARVLQCTEGAHPMTIMVTLAFPSLEALGAHRDAMNSDANWQEYWAGVMANPSAQLVRSGIYTMVP
ncbi:hypothetical protein [Sandarakinorhabdus rubra]|uniref:hypothetical protein n=1 Tax=Sandarakinorhabdus rubra TaxID=2672568 RepID=UPI0013DB74BE|nr:hypothetical protein [Sandarakinorhabdus rubra]